MEHVLQDLRVIERDVMQVVADVEPKHRITIGTTSRKLEASPGSTR